MFDINAKDGSVRTTEYESPLPKSENKAQGVKKRHELDGPAMVELHRKLLTMFHTEQDRQYANRAEMAEEEDFYDNEQWDPADKEVLISRGQVPMVYNVISPTVDWITGSEKRSRTDAKVLPRRKQDAKPAQRKTELIKYLSDVNRTPFVRSRAFEDAVRVGLGWIEDGYQADTDGEPLYSRYENWRNILHDSAATEPDLSDGRYIFRMKWFDLDVISSIFKERKGVLENAAQVSPGLNGLDELSDEITDQHELELDRATASSSASATLGYHDRQRVRVIEAWIRVPTETQKLSGGLFAGEIFDPLSPGHQEALKSGDSELVDKTTMQIHVAIFTTAGMLYYGPSPYRHNEFPFTPVWGFRRGKNNLPYGIIRRLKDIQVDVNKRASKALHILSSNKIVMDKGAVDDIDELAEEAARPDAIIVKNPGKELTLDAERDLAQGHLDLMSRSIAMIQQTSGVTDELLGRKTNATSGVAIQRRQEQGSLATAKLFDNLLYAEQVRGEKVLANIEQFMTEKKSFRITNQRGTPQYIDINDGLPENDIPRTKADFVISDQSWNATIRQSQFEVLMDMVGKLPGEVSLALLDLAIEASDLPNVDELVRRIRQINGQNDPDADPDDISEEEIARRQAAAEEAALAKEIAMAALQEKRANTALKEAQAKSMLDKSVESKVTAQTKALGAAKEALAAPKTLDVADHILHESGFVSRSDMEQAAQDDLRAAQLEQAKAERERQVEQQIFQPGQDTNAGPEALNQTQQPVPTMEPPQQ